MKDLNVVSVAYGAQSVLLLCTQHNILVVLTIATSHWQVSLTAAVTMVVLILPRRAILTCLILKYGVPSLCCVMLV